MRDFRADFIIWYKLEYRKIKGLMGVNGVEIILNIISSIKEEFICILIIEFPLKSFCCMREGSFDQTCRTLQGCSECLECSAGKVKYEEIPVQGLYREAKEEINLDVELLEELSVRNLKSKS